MTWRFMPAYDRLLTQAEIDGLPEPARSNILDHVYLDAASGLFVLCADNARFMNHADAPNTAGVHEDGAIEGYDVATRDIVAGEELTCDYRTFDADVGVKLGSADKPPAMSRPGMTRSAAASLRLPAPPLDRQARAKPRRPEPGAADRARNIRHNGAKTPDAANPHRKHGRDSAAIRTSTENSS